MYITDPTIRFDLNFVPMGFETKDYKDLNEFLLNLNFVPMGFETKKKRLRIVKQ